MELTLLAILQALIQDVPLAPSAKPAPEGIDRIRAYFERLWDNLVPQFTSEVGLFQIGAILAALLISIIAGRLLRGRIAKLWAEPANAYLKSLREGVLGLFWPLLFAGLVFVAMAVFEFLEMPADILRIVSNLALAWALIRLISSAILDRGLARFVSFVGWFIAALAITNLLQPTGSLLESINLSIIGLPNISILRMIQAVAVTVGLFWFALVLARLIQGQMTRSSRLPPSVRVLAIQVIRLSLIAMAVVLALSVIGINITALTVLTGAIGVGLGFGLRSIFENFISGIILIFERSLQVGDFVELEDGINGTVREVNVRSTVITTNDNIDILVPNSQFISGRVTNWTHRETSRRLRLPFGVAYGSDKELVKQAALDAAENVRHTLKSIPGREADCWLVNFGNSSLDFELVVWIADWSVSRPARVRAEYYWALHSALERYGITIPFPQLDLHVKSGLPSKSE